MAGTEQEWNELARESLSYASTYNLSEATNAAGKAWVDSVDDALYEDYVNSPPHYNSGAVECIEAIKASMSTEEYKGYLKGNTLKYLWRYNYKGKPVEDIEKARWYLEKLYLEVLDS